VPRKQDPPQKKLYARFREKNGRALDRAALKKLVREENIQIIGGHAPYRDMAWLIPPERTLVFFRDPVERVVSSHSMGVRRKGLTLGLMEWARHPNQMNKQSRLVAGLDLDKAFVGITEHYNESIERLMARWPHLRLQPQTNNVNPDKPMGARYKIDPSVRAELERLNADDMELYERVRKLYE
jgi:hypothetical protein